MTTNTNTVFLDAVDDIARKMLSKPPREISSDTMLARIEHVESLIYARELALVEKSIKEVRGAMESYLRRSREAAQSPRVIAAWLRKTYPCLSWRPLYSSEVTSSALLEIDLFKQRAPIEFLFSALETLESAVIDAEEGEVSSQSNQLLSCVVRPLVYRRGKAPEGFATDVAPLAMRLTGLIDRHLDSLNVEVMYGRVAHSMAKEIAA